MFTCNYRASANSFTSLCLPCHAVNSSGSSVIAYSASEYNTRFWSMSLELIWEKSFRVPCSCVVESTFFMECGMQKCCTGTNCGTGEAAFMYWFHFHFLTPTFADSGVLLLLMGTGDAAFMYHGVCGRPSVGCFGGTFTYHCIIVLGGTSDLEQHTILAELLEPWL
jgi:hypothetical protein